MGKKLAKSNGTRQANRRHDVDRVLPERGRRGTDPFEDLPRTSSEVYQWLHKRRGIPLLDKELRSRCPPGSLLAAEPDGTPAGIGLEVARDVVRDVDRNAMRSRGRARSESSVGRAKLVGVRESLAGVR